MSTDIRQSPLYIVDNSSVQQMFRIRQYLGRYHNSFFSLSYIDGTGKYIDSSYDIWVNLCLITSKVRPSFMIQWIDYLDPKIFERIMNLLLHYRDNLDPRDIDYRLLFITDRQGVIVTTYYTYYKNNLSKIITDYSISTGDSSESLLGLILGYPAAGEILLTPDDNEYLYNNEQPPGRYSFSLYISSYRLGTKHFFGNIYRTSQSRNKLYEFYKRVVMAIKVYDPESLVLVDDSQGSLVPSNIVYHPSPIDTIEVTPDMETQYQTYIKDPLLLEKNWNDYFDRIFETGYRYNR